MKTPIEKYGWKEDKDFWMSDTKIRFSRNNDREYLIFDKYDGKVDIHNGLGGILQEEIQAIYETSKQIVETITKGET